MGAPPFSLAVSGKRLCLLLLLTAAIPGLHGGTPLMLESGVKSVPLLELYTSEGCSSCPPAEAWLSGLKDNPGLWKEFVPVSFHVDYWNSLGWSDPYSSGEFTARQRSYAAAWNSTTVYTPEFVLGGREWNPDQGPLHSSEKRVGNLKVLLSGKEISVIFLPEKNEQGPFSADVALLGRNVKTSIRAGENEGRTLTHDFLVLKLQETPLKSGDNGEYQGKLSLSDTGSISPTSIAVWVSQGENPAPIQAVGGNLP